MSNHKHCDRCGCEIPYKTQAYIGLNNMHGSWTFVCNECARYMADGEND